jgi:hypothetical protein
MVSFSRRHMHLASTAAACLLLAGCGADDVASPGAGEVVIVNPTPTPTTPTPTTPTPTPITAAQFAAAGSQSGVTVTADEQFALINAGANNNVNGTGASINGVYPTTATSLATAANPATINSFFQSTNFVGAFNGPTDTSFQGWTCNSTTAQFGGTGAACTAVPAVGTGGSAAACPTGTSDDGIVQTFRACRLPTVITGALSLPRIPGVFYRFRGQTEVGVPGGAAGQLTIAAGVVLAADSSEASNDLLLVNPGSTITAVGTATDPIIFTAQQNLANNGVSDSSQGFWGGIILLGRAPIGVCSGSGVTNDAAGSNANCINQIEGVQGRSYGGTNAADNSGTLQYVQIRYSGIAISEGNELQGLTLGGTGSGTTIDHIQSHNSADDGVEIFGGTTNIRYFAVTGADDDGFDLDYGYRGFLQFLVAAQRINGATADSFSTEIDSNGGEDLLPRTFPRIANYTFIQTSTAPAAMRIRGGTDVTFVNGVVKSVSPCTNIVAGNTVNGAAATGNDRSTIRTANEALQDVGPPTFTSNYFACSGR